MPAPADKELKDSATDGWKGRFRWPKNKLFSSKERPKIETNAVVHNSNSSVDAATTASPPKGQFVANNDSGTKEELDSDPASDAPTSPALLKGQVAANNDSGTREESVSGLASDASGSTSVRTSIEMSPVLVEASKKLSEAIEKLQDVCKTAKCMKDIPTVFDAQWAKALIEGRSDSELPSGSFATTVQQTVLAKLEKNNQGIPARVGNVLQKVHPIAEVVLGVGEYVDQSLSVPGLALACQVITFVFTVADTVHKDVKLIQDTLEKFVDYRSVVGIIRDARLDTSLDINVAIIKDTILLYVALLDFLRGSLQFVQEGSAVSGAWAVVKQSHVQERKEPLEAAMSTLSTELGIAGNTYLLRTSQQTQDEAMLNRISKLIFTERHNQLRDLHVKDTGEWIFETEAFRQWIRQRSATASTLWCYGAAGSGKTYLASNVIARISSPTFQAEVLKRRTLSKLVPVAYAYCDSDRQHQQTSLELIRSIVRQLVEQMVRINAVAIRGPAGGISRSPSLEDSVDFLKKHVLNRVDRPFVVIDGANELASNYEGVDHRQLIIDQLLGLPIRLLITGPRSIRGTLGTKKVIELEVNPVESDVRKYMTAKLRTSGKLSRAYPEDVARQEFIETIIQKVWTSIPENFSLIASHTKYILTGSSPGDMKECAEHPVNSSELCLKVLTRYKTKGSEASWNQTREIISWLLFTPPQRLLTMLELQHVLALRTKRTVRCTQDQDEYRLTEYDLLDYVSALIDYSPATKIVDFSHKSIRTFLMSPTVQETYFGDWEPRHHLATACLNYLSADGVFTEVPRTKDGFEREIEREALRSRNSKYPFADYADHLWAYHSRGDPEVTLQSQILDFLSKGPHLTNVPWFQLIDLNKGPGKVIYRPRFYGRFIYPSDIPTYKLAVSAYHDLSGILSALMGPKFEPEDSDSNEEQTRHGDEARCNVLHVAAYRGHTDFIRKFQGLCEKEEFELLLNENDVRGATPLHYACDEKFQGAAELLLRMGATPYNWVQKSGESAYYCAVINHLTAIVKQICEQDPIVGKRRLLSQGVTTALHLAIKLGYTDMVQVLLEFKPNLRAQDSEGKTPLQLADSGPVKDLLLMAMDREHSKLTHENEESNRQIDHLSKENDKLRSQLEALQSQTSS